MMNETEKKQFAELAARIAWLRDSEGYTVEEFAEKLGIDAEVYRGYETTGYDIPASALMHIAHYCHIGLSELMTGSSARLDTYQIVRKGQGREIDRFPGYHFKDLAFNYAHKVMQPLLVTLDPSEDPAELVVHEGQEFNYVLSGTLLLDFADRQIELEAGDSAYFNPALPHGQRCAGDEPVSFITVVTE
jgi:mannose-6-phosphate isomerase-like protein (cupin superfamily)